MPVTLLDLILLGVMLISGLLAMVRGFMREILSIAAWGAAAIVTLYSFSKLLPTAKTYFNNDTVASVVVVAGVFVGGGMLWVHDYLLPHSNHRLRVLQGDIARAG